MSGPTRDDESPDYSRFAPKRFREQPPTTSEQRPYVPSAPTVPAPRTPSPERRAASDFPSWPEPVPEPPPPPHRLDEGPSALISRVALVVTFAAVVALVLIFARPISQGAHALVDATSRLFGSSKSTDLLTASTASESTSSTTRTASASVAAPVPAPVAQAPAANPQPAPAAVAQPAPSTVAQASSGGQQLSLSSPGQPLGQDTSGPKVMVRGVTDTEIRFGISAPFSGAAKELGQNMRLGIEAAFNAANARGGVNGRQLKLIAADDGYEPARTADTMKRLYERDQIFAVVGNVGTPTAAVALPYALDRKMLFFGAFTGAGLLRSDPPDRYVFNYRASYAEETAATVQYLVKVKRLKPSQIAVFAQQDAYGDAGFSGVAKAIRALGGDENAILRLHYQRNTVDVDDAVDQLRKSRIPIRAVIMVPAYRAAAKFIEKTRDLFPGMIYTSVSFVGSTALANELMLLGKRFASGVIVTQVVPALDGHSSLVLDYKAALSKYFPGEQPDYVSLEGYVAANVLITALRRNGPDLDTEKLVTTLENLRDLDIGLGTPVSFGRSEHQGVHKVWGTQIDDNGRYQPIDLQ
jgi:branched-chain amino acid transport system substrate-binding protein